MKKRGLKLLLILCLLVFKTTTYGQSKNSNYDIAKNIFKVTLTKEPKFVVFDDSIKNFIIGITEDFENLPSIKIEKLTLVNQNWQLIKSISVGNGNWNDYLNDTAFLVSLNKETYIYYSSNYGIRATGEEAVDFNLVDLQLENTYTLNVTGEYQKDETVKGDFSYSDNLKNSLELKNYLEGVTKKSKFVYKKSSDDYNINSTKNFEKKFKITNANLFRTNKLKIETFKPIYYTENLEKYINSSVTKIENTNFKILSFFKYGIIGYDKRIKKYFPIYFQDNVLDIITAKFKETDKIIIKSHMDDKPRLIIDFKKFQYIEL